MNGRADLGDRTKTPAPSRHFADRLVARVRALGHPLCLGLDPHLPAIPPLFRRGTMEPGDPATAPQVEAFLTAVLERYAGEVAVVKPQVAFFEQLGWRGWKVLEAVVERARSLGFLVLLDGKRGDIGSTAAAYARCLDPEAPLFVDAVTVNPYLGRDAVQPFLDAARSSGGGVFVLVKTSNPGAAEVQDLPAGGRPLFAAVAELWRDSCAELRGESGWSSLGVVVGATHPEDAERVRALLPHALFLVPGFGAQGASAEDAVRGFVPGPQGKREGGIVNASRALLFPAGATSESARTWEEAIDRARRQAIDQLRRAVER